MGRRGGEGRPHGGLKRISNGPTTQDVDTTLRSPAALTAALMGLVDADAMIGPQLGKVGKTRK